MAIPTVVLIGGTSGAGKTTLGRALAAKLDAVSLTCDDLALALRAITTPESHPGLHLMNIPNAADYFTFSSVEKLIADASAQQKAVWPAIERVIRVRAKQKTRIVIDGWFLRPSEVATLGIENLTSFWINVDRNILEERERVLTKDLGQSSEPERMLQTFLGRSYWHNDLIRRQAEREGLTVLRQDGNVSVEEMCSTVINELEKS
jgi:2-phosphoglycerate kinase